MKVRRLEGALERDIDRGWEWRLPMFTEEQLRLGWSEDEWDVIERACLQIIPWARYSYRTVLYKRYSTRASRVAGWKGEVPKSPRTPKGQKSPDDVIVEKYGEADTAEAQRYQCRMLSTVSDLAKLRGYFYPPAGTPLRWRWHKSSPNKGIPLPKRTAIY